MCLSGVGRMVPVRKRGGGCEGGGGSDAPAAWLRCGDSGRRGRPPGGVEDVREAGAAMTREAGCDAAKVRRRGRGVPPKAPPKALPKGFAHSRY
jgi:hypothetical protein